MTKLTATDFISFCKKRDVKIKFNSFGRVYFSGAGIDVRECRDRILYNPVIEPRLLLEMAGKDSNLKDMLDERECILWAEGLPCAPLDVAWAICGPEIIKDEIIQKK